MIEFLNEKFLVGYCGMLAKVWRSQYRELALQLQQGHLLPFLQICQDSRGGSLNIVIRPRQPNVESKACSIIVLCFALHGATLALLPARPTRTVGQHVFEILEAYHATTRLSSTQPVSRTALTKPAGTRISNNKVKALATR